MSVRPLWIRASLGRDGGLPPLSDLTVRNTIWGSVLMLTFAAKSRHNFAFASFIRRLASLHASSHSCRLFCMLRPRRFLCFTAVRISSFHQGLALWPQRDVGMDLSAAFMMQDERNLTLSSKLRSDGSRSKPFCSSAWNLGQSALFHDHLNLGVSQASVPFTSTVVMMGLWSEPRSSHTRQWHMFAIWLPAKVTSGDVSPVPDQPLRVWQLMSFSTDILSSRTALYGSSSRIQRASCRKNRRRYATAPSGSETRTERLGSISPNSSFRIIVKAGHPITWDTVSSCSPQWRHEDCCSGSMFCVVST